MPPKKPFRRVGRNGQASYAGGSRNLNTRGPSTISSASLLSSERTSASEKFEFLRAAHAIDERMGFARYDAGRARIGWLVNMKSTTIEDASVPGGRAAVEYYFIGEDGATFKAALEYSPYFLIAVRRGREQEVEEWVRRAVADGAVSNVERLEKEDLSMPNHLLGYRRGLLKLSFRNVSDLLAARKEIMPVAERNRKKMGAMDTYAEVASATAGFDIFDEEDQYNSRKGVVDPSDFIIDIREYDVPYHVRVAIDRGRFTWEMSSGDY